jgi:hypothetical protein
MIFLNFRALIGVLEEKYQSVGSEKWLFEAKTILFDE